MRHASAGSSLYRFFRKLPVWPASGCESNIVHEDFSIAMLIFSRYTTPEN
jgi:hypothetical protein